MFWLMNRLNYHHLLYFWTVAKYGGLSRAAEELLLTRSTLSAQIHSLESTLGQQLMRRHGRQLKLTDTGRVVFEYCERMFAIGRELGEVVGDQKLQRPKQLRVGVADVIPRLMLGKLLRPLLVGPEAVRLVCREDHARTLLAELSIHNLDLVISDSPVGSSAHIRGHSHRLGASAVAIFGSKAMALKFKGNFPRSLDGAPFFPLTVHRSCCPGPTACCDQIWRSGLVARECGRKLWANSMIGICSRCLDSKRLVSFLHRWPSAENWRANTEQHWSDSQET